MAELHAWVEWPDWIPVETQHYLKHTVGGVPIRKLAREAGVHASTILRQVRKVEQRRDDPLLESALHAMGEKMAAPAQPDHFDLVQALRKLSEPQALLAVGRGMDQAVIVRNMGGGGPVQSTPIARRIAEMLSLRDWVAPLSLSERVVRYQITGQGRTALRELIAASENSAREMAEAAVPFDHKPSADGPARKRARRMVTLESPVQQLARRREKEGQPFLSHEMVRAAERLREDFEIASFGEIIVDEMEEVQASLARPGRNANVTAAKQRVGAAFDFLGPGLSDVALRCCCLLEGMESVERHMGWSARSGKIVLRIALQRLLLHYEADGALGPMIG